MNQTHDAQVAKVWRDRPVLLATRSAGKAREVAAILEHAGVQVASLATTARHAPDPYEDLLEVHERFEDNALAKARWFFAQDDVASAFGMVLADDSGLEVDALGGLPGVRSKRWSGRDDLDGRELDSANNAFLLERLAASGASERTARAARYVCAAAAVWQGGELVLRGTTAGSIELVPNGAGGFGYDPYFWSDDLQATFGEVSREAKDGVSHRGRAFRALVGALQRIHA